MDKPTKEQIEEARAVLIKGVDDDGCDIVIQSRGMSAIRVLLAATEQPPRVPRPTSVCELAKKVAQKLRAKGFPAKQSELADSIIENSSARRDALKTQYWSMNRNEFDSMNADEIADAIQREEARKAAEWAGDK